jgi:MFS family permease
MISHSHPDKNRSFNHHNINIIFTSNLLLSFHFFLIIYINSSLLDQFFSSSVLSLLYILGSVFNLAIFINAPSILKYLGNYKFTLWAIILEAVAIMGLIFALDPILVALAFILHQAVISMILFGLDIFLEGAITDEKHTGMLRGIFLTLSNLTLVFSPLIVGILVKENNFKIVYTISLLFLIPLFILIKTQLKNAKYKYLKRVGFFHAFLEARKNRDLHGVLYAHFLLQFFYAFMVIYMPIYLTVHIGFTWEQLGVIFTIMLLPFLMFELPIGTLADKKYGEKEFMIAGFIIMMLSTFYIPFITTASVMLWSALLFFTRVGASFVEITCESHFFKKVNEQNASLISFFRMARPLAYISAPVFVTVLLFLFKIFDIKYVFIFSILSLCLTAGLYYSSVYIVDTK